MSSITKNRNLFTLTHEHMTKPVVFDVNTCQFTRDGQPCLRTPAYAKIALDDCWAERRQSNVVMMLHNLCVRSNRPMTAMPNLRDAFAMADKLDAIGYNCLNHGDKHIIEYQGEREYLSANFKFFAKYVRENPQGNYEDWKHTFKREQMMASYAFPKDYHVLPALKSFIGDYGDRYEEADRPYVVYWLCHGVFNFFYNGEPTGNFSNTRWMANMAGYISNMLSMCHEMNRKPEKEDFFRQYGTVQQNYRVFKEQVDSDKLAVYQNSKPLAFENDKLTVIIPVTPTEFANEAQYQQNCVYSYYLHRVVDGETHVVFIRKKDDMDTPYITCEIDNRGRIIQYLAHYNNTVTDEVGLNFYNEYKAYLRSIF